jgi:signal transduction histidine kinase
VSRRHDPDASLVERATHDLLNPIASMLGLGETLRARGSSLDDATLRSFGESIARQAARLERALRDLASASALLRDDPPVEVGDVSTADLMDAIDDERVRFDVDNGHVVRADRALLYGALKRLVDNALEHSGGEVLVRVDRRGIEVADQGTGFTPEGLEALFEPLSGGVNAKGERGPGLGLGLFIARRLVEAMGGTLTATSAPGKGSVFRIELPA